MTQNDEMLAAVGCMTDEERKKFVSFSEFPARYWTIKTKSKGYQPMALAPAQVLMEYEYNRQMDERGFVRMNILKCRQVYCSTFWTRKALMYTIQHDAVTALTIAHETGLPSQWIGECKRHVEETPYWLCPDLKTGQQNRLTFANGSSYYIGSAQGGFPGMGDTVHFRHHSEMGRWDKPPISKDPDEVLIPLDPATPKGADMINTVQVYESTGVMVGDWWYKKWTRGKEKDDEYVNLFLPWYLVVTYRRDDLTSDVLSLSQYEQWSVKEASKHGVELSHSQIAWYRNELRQPPYFGNEAKFKAEFPADEIESFMSPGETVYSPEQVKAAKGTIREPKWKGALLGVDKPDEAKWVPNSESGDTLIWEFPDANYHYVLGADCMWGKSQDADWDVLYVECLETGRKVARIRDRYQMPEWAWKIAAIGHKYNTCPVAPERNLRAGADSDGVMATLRGAVSNWAYPNVWIDSDEVKFRGHKPEGYGWNTTGPSKQKLIAYSQAQTNVSGYDWCDSMAVDEMATIITHEDQSRGAPKGSKDDCWMASLITSYVAHRVRAYTDLYTEPSKKVYQLHIRTMEERLEDMDKESENGDENEY